MNLFVHSDGRPRAGWRLLAQYIIMFFVVGAFTLTLRDLLSSSSRLVITFASFVGITFSIWVSSRFLDRRPMQEYGVRFNTLWLGEFLAGTAIAAFAMSCVFVVEWQLDWLVVTGYGWETATPAAFGRALGSYLLVMLMVGFYEELLSRGYQILNLAEGLRFQPLGYRGAVIIAVLITSALFGLLHLNNPNASLTSTFNIILAGVVLAIPYILTGSLALSAGLHFGWNFIQGGIWGFPVSGLSFDLSVLQIHQQGEALWTGGSFGPEGGLIGLIGMAIMLGGSYVYILKAGYEPTIADVFKKSS